MHASDGPLLPLLLLLLPTRSCGRSVSMPASSLCLCCQADPRTHFFISSHLHPQTLVDPERKVYEVSSQMSIEFEVDGPYKVGSIGRGRRTAAGVEARLPRLACLCADASHPYCLPDG